MMILEKCPSQVELRALSLGQLTEEKSSELLSHLEKCETCQEEMGTSDEDDSLLQHLRTGDSESSDFLREVECQQALANSLGALSQIDVQAIHENEISRNLPSVLGDYEIVRPIGGGGMGAVYLARHSKLGRQVALKVLANHRLGEPRMRRRFESEMRSVGQLSHPNIVTAHDAREFDGMAVLVTEYIEGLDVGKVLRRLGTLPVADACEIASQTALALDYVDRQGMVHRDIKPSNVMLSVTGDVKLLDLGLARPPVRDDGLSAMTVTGQAVGTADYIAPEQVDDGRNVDIRSDIYSLGCALFKMLCGRPPFDSEIYRTEFAKMTAHVSAAPPSILDQVPGLPVELGDLVEKMVAKDPNDRPQTPAEVVEQLAKFTAESDLKQLADRAMATELKAQPVYQETISTPAIVSTQTTKNSLQRSPFYLAITSGLVAFALGIGIGYALGITVKVKRPDGTVATVEIPDGATAIVSENGDVEVALASGGETAIEPGADSIASVPDSGVNQKFEVIQKAKDEYPLQIVSPKGAISHSSVSMLQGVWRLVGSSDPSAPKLLGFVNDHVFIPNKFGRELVDVFPVRAKALDGYLYWNGERYRSEFLDGYSLDISNGKSFQNYERIGLLKQGKKNLDDLTANLGLPDRFKSRDMKKEFADFQSDAMNAKFWECVDSHAALRQAPLPAISSARKPLEMLQGVWLIEPSDGTMGNASRQENAGFKDYSGISFETEIPRAIVFFKNELLAVNHDKSITKLNFEIDESGPRNPMIVMEHPYPGAKHKLKASYPLISSENRVTILTGGARWVMSVVYSRAAGDSEVNGAATVAKQMKTIEDKDLLQLKGQGRTLDLVPAFAAIAEYQRTGKFPSGIDVKSQFPKVAKAKNLDDAVNQKYELKGRVVLASEESVPLKSELRIYEINRNKNLQELIVTYETTPDGIFSFSFLPRFSEDSDSRLILACRRDGFATRFVQADFWLRDNKEWKLNPESESYSLDVKLSPSAKVTGRVVDDNGDPIVGAVIHQWPLLVEAIEGFGSSKTDSQGRFEIEDIPPFKAHKVGKNGFRPATNLILKHPDFGAYRIHTSKIPNDLQVKIKKPVVVVGKVVDGDNNPLGGITVTAQTQNLDRRLFDEGLETGKLMPLEWLITDTNVNGEFRFLMPADSKYNVLIDGARSAAVDMTGRTDSKIDLGKIIGSQTVEVAGVVIRHETGEPVQEIVSVGWHGPDRPKTSAAIRLVKTDRQGSFVAAMVAGENFPYICSGSEDGMAFETVELRSKTGEVYDAQNPFKVIKGEPVDLEIVVRKIKPPHADF